VSKMCRKKQNARHSSVSKKAKCSS